MMKLRFDKYKIADEIKPEFEREVLKNNFNGLFSASAILLVFEVFLYTIEDKLYGTGNVILAFIIASIFLVPTIGIIRKKSDTIPIVISKTIQFIYCNVILYFSIALFLISQSQIDLFYIYVSVVFGISFFISMNAFDRTLILLPALIVIYLFLPHFQQDPEITFVVVINMAIINSLAWALGFVSRNYRKDAFLHKKILLEKTLLLEELIKKDAMTGLYNHNASFQKLKEEIDYANRTGNPLSIIILDIDDFKKINDSYGHLRGDSVLIEVSNIMANITRTIDTVGRYGGEEFIIILPATDIEGARILSQKIKSAMDSHSFENNISITFSGGVSQYRNESVEELIQLTDEKLYIAKRSGKNRFIHSR